MPYMTVGDNGRMVVDEVTQDANSIFEGLGKKKRGILRKVKKVLKKAVSIPKKIHATVKAVHKKLSPVAKLKSKFAPKKKQRGGVEQGEPTGVVEEYGPVPEDSGPSYPMPTESDEGYPIDEESYPPPEPIEDRESYPPDAARVPEEEYASPPPIEQRTDSGYTIEPGEEPWSRGPQQQVEEEGDGQQQEYVTDSEPFDNSVEGPCCGGYILTGPSPKQRDFEKKRSMAAALHTPPYKGLGQPVPFWYRPEWAFKRRTPTSIAPPPEESVHTGSKWGQFDSAAMAAARRAADPFASQGRRKRQRGRPRRAAGLPF